MCGKFTWMLSWAEVHFLSGLTGGDGGAGMSDEAYRAAETDGELRRSTPMTEAPILHLNGAGERTVTMMRWGWPKEFGAKNGRDLHMHAKAETIDTLRTFGDAFRTRRGVAWTTNFNEGETLPNGRTRQWVCWTPGRKAIPIAVLYQLFEHPGGDTLLAFVMATTAECPQLAALKIERMPAILQSEADIALWLGEQQAPLHDVKAVLRPYPGELIMEPQERPKPPRPPKPPPGTRETPRLF